MGAKDGGGSAAHSRKKTKKRIKSKRTHFDKIIKEAVSPKQKELIQKSRDRSNGKKGDQETQRGLIRHSPTLTERREGMRMLLMKVLTVKESM